MRRIRCKIEPAVNDPERPGEHRSNAFGLFTRDARVFGDREKVRLDKTD